MELSSSLSRSLYEEAALIGREWLEADWWVTPRRKPLLEEPERALSKRLRAWAVRVVKSVLGHRVYQARIAFGREKSTAIVKAETARGEYRVLLVTASLFENVRFEGKNRFMPIISLVFYGKMSDKNASALDRFKPRMMRSYRARGYAIAAYKHRIAGEEGDLGKRLAVVGADPEIGDREDTIVIHRSITSREAKAVDRIGSLEIRAAGKTLGRLSWTEYVQCASVEAWLIESQSKWILPIPPVLLMKWYYDVSLEALRRSPLGDLCRSLRG